MWRACSPSAEAKGTRQGVTGVGCQFIIRQTGDTNMPKDMSWGCKRKSRYQQKTYTYMKKKQTLPNLQM